LGGIFHRFVIPLFKTHGNALARDALRTGVNVVEDVLDGRTLKESVKRRVPEGIKRSAQSLIRQSCECTKSELDLFSVPPTQTSMEHGSWVEYHPLTTVTDGSPIEFDVSGSGDDYVDFANTMLHVKAKVTHGNDTDLAADSVMGPVNLFLHSLFSQVDISLNGTLNFLDQHLSVSGHDRDAAQLRHGRQNVPADIRSLLQRHRRQYG